MSGRETLIQKAIEEWAVIAGGPSSRHGSEPTLAHYIESVLANAEKPSKVTVHFVGGPWHGQTYEVEMVVGPLFAVGHEVGNHYWLDSKSDPPTYQWAGPPITPTSGGES